MFKTAGEGHSLIWASAIVAATFLIANPLMARTYNMLVCPPGVMPAKSVQEFRSGVCTNAHWYFGSTPYTTAYATLKTAILDLGMTCLRDQWSPGDTVQKDRFVDLAASGVKHSVIIDSRYFNDTAADRTQADTDSSGAVSVAEAIDHLLDNAPGSVLALEGPNELLGSNCASAITQLQEIWAVKQSDSRLADIPVLSPAAAQPTQNSCLGDQSAYTDEGNIHSYPGDSPPEATERGADWSLAGWKNHVQSVVGQGVPITATETGYHNAVNTTDGHLPVSETADGKYMAQLYFAYQRAGVHRAHKYELVNQFSNPGLDNIQGHFGFLRNNLTEKPSYVSVDNMMDILADSGPTTLNPLDYQLTTGTGTVRSYLLQKSDGSHWLAVWNDVKIWDTTLGDLSPADVSVTLTLQQTRTIDTYRPYVSASVQDSVVASSKVLSVGADPVLVKIQ